MVQNQDVPEYEDSAQLNSSPLSLLWGKLTLNDHMRTWSCLDTEMQVNLICGHQEYFLECEQMVELWSNIGKQGQSKLWALISGNQQ